ncbi:MAG: ComEC/Rec2 family competence protein, partial [Hyphomicrobiaceae bacterium]
MFAVGIALYFGLATEPHPLSASLPIAMAVALRLILRSYPPARMALNAMIVVAIGFGMAKLRTEWVRAPVLSQPIRKAVVIGHIERVEHRADDTQRLTLHVVEIEGLAANRTPQRVRIRLRDASAVIRAGNTVHIVARLAGPPPPAQPRGYDFARAAFFQGIGGVGYALSRPQAIESDRPQPIAVRVNTYLQELRTGIGQRIERALPGETGIMANALMTGERSGISQETNDLYRDAGIFH